MEAYQKLEVQWAEFNELDPAGMVACSSGTAALHLALEAFQLPPWVEVLVPNYTMIACPRAVAMAGLKPMFVDCDKRLLMSEESLFDFLRDTTVYGRLGAVMFVHIYGRKANVNEMGQWVLDVGAKVIEDLAEAHGIRPSHQTDAACWSFYKNKIVAGEEGGAVWFRDPKHAALARQLRSLGFTAAHDFDHVPRGHNYRLANCLAEKVLHSLSKYGRIVDHRRVVEAYMDTLCPTTWKMPPREAPWVYDMRVPLKDKYATIAKLNAEGIAARHGFKPMHLQREFWRLGQFPISESLWKEVMYLPFNLSGNQIDKAFSILKEG